MSLMKRFGRGGRPLRIAYGRIFHEANAFSPLLTERVDFERFHFLQGETLAKACRITGHELKGFLRQAELSGPLNLFSARGVSCLCRSVSDTTADSA